MKEGRVRLNRGTNSFKYELHKDNNQTTTDFWLCKSKDEGGPVVRQLVRNETSPGVQGQRTKA